MTLREAWQLTRSDEEEGQVAGHVRRLRIQDQLPYADWLDRPLVEITPGDLPQAAHQDRRENGTYMANGIMRVLRAIWRRARRQHPELPETPTANVDFYPEPAAPTSSRIGPHGGRHPADRQPGAARLLCLVGVLRMPGRGDHEMEVKNIDLETRHGEISDHQDQAFEMPLSDYMVELLRNRIAENARNRRELPMGVPVGHVGDRSPGRREADSSRGRSCSPSNGRPIRCGIRWITAADQKVEDLRQPPARADQSQAEARQEQRRACRLHPSRY